MKLTDDPRYNIAYVRFQEKQAEVEAIRISDELVVDMAPVSTTSKSAAPTAAATRPRVQNTVFLLNSMSTYRLSYGTARR